MYRDLDFNYAPLLVIWEVTRTCALACRHCRAEAMEIKDPRELNLDEGRNLIDDIAASCSLYQQGAE